MRWWLVGGLRCALVAGAVFLGGADAPRHDWKGPGWYLVDSSGLGTFLAAGPFSNDADCRADPMFDSNFDDCQYFNSDPPWDHD